MRTRLYRRDWLGFGLGLSVTSAARALFAASSQSSPEDPGFFVKTDLKLKGDRELARRALVLVPREVPDGARLPVLVLLHGLGETKSEEAGINAWVDRYGLLTCHKRLHRQSVTPDAARGDLTAEHAREINDDLARRPFDGKLVLVCPFTPNVWRLPDPRQALDRYAGWIADVLLPEVHARTPADPSPARTSIDGCSLGGFIGLEVFLRKPQLFAAWGGVQSALGEAAAPGYANRLSDALASAGPRRLHVETSTGDAFYRANLALSRELKKKGVPHDFAALPGPHDQPFLREVGTLEMLLWHDRALLGG